MKTLNKFFFIFILFLTTVGSSFSSEPIAYLDIDFIIKNSDIGKKSLARINDLNKENINNLKKRKKY